jgi:hypothetical protein
MRFNSREAALLGIPDLPQGAFEHVGDRKIKPQGGGGGGPTTNTTQTSNIPEYAKPYVENMLQSGQTQIYNDDMTTFRPYQAYSSNVNDYFAGFSPMQTQAQQAAGQMQTPGQFAAGTGLAGAAGLGQLGTAGQAGMYGAQGAGLGQLGMFGAMPAFGAGQQFAQQVTDPNAVAQYMSPYQQQVTDIAKTDAVRNAQLAQQQANLGSVRQGTYGGARQALAQSEREKNLMSNLSNIQAQGSQSAFDKAMQTQQFGAGLGLQGIQTGLQGIQQGLAGTAQGLQGVGAQQAGYAGAGQAAATLGGLGSQQQAANINQINLQSQMGGQQQQLEQNKINQAIQDYATQQQYPFMQLGMMNALLRGLPLQQTTTQQYQAQPGFAQQAMGLGLGAAGLSKAFGT